MKKNKGLSTQGLAKQPSTSLKSKTSLPKKSLIRKVSANPKKQVKPSVAKLKKEADKWHSKAVRLAWANPDGSVKCMTCTNVKDIKQMQCGHFMSRAHNSTRYDEENTAPQCYGCNVMHQGRQYEFGVQIDLYYGAGTAKKLAKLAKEKKQFKPEELEEIINDRKEQVRFYERTD